MKHIWTYREEYLVAMDFIEMTVVGKIEITIGEYANRMASQFPDITVQSIKMKAQNIKGYLEILKIPCAAIGSTLNHSSKQCRQAVNEVLQHYKNDLAEMGIDINKIKYIT